MELASCTKFVRLLLNVADVKLGLFFQAQLSK